MIEDIRKEKATVVTIQGIGDIFWNYQKLIPFYKEIDLQIYTISNWEPPKVQQRAKGVYDLFPKITSVNFADTTLENYVKVATEKKMVKNILDSGEEHYEYSCNMFLEQGIRIDEIEDLPVAWDIPLPTEPVALPKEYICLYASGVGTGRPGTTIWPPGTWIELISIFEEKYGIPQDFPIVIIGAFWDVWVIEAFSHILKERGIFHRIFIDLSWPKVFHILKNSLFFFGYQSGLNLLADNMDVPQLMMWFDELHKMPFTFPKRKNIEDGIYNAAIFSKSDLKRLVDENIHWGGNTHMEGVSVLNKDISMYYSKERAEIQEEDWKDSRWYKTYSAHVVKTLVDRNLERVLEVACGSGFIPTELKGNIKYMGIDDNPFFIDWAISKNEKENRIFLKEDLRNLDVQWLRDHSFEPQLVICFGTLKHFGLDEWDDILIRILSLAPNSIFGVQICDSDFDNGTDFHHVFVTQEHLEKVVDLGGHKYLYDVMTNWNKIPQGNVIEKIVFTERK